MERKSLFYSCYKRKKNVFIIEKNGDFFLYYVKKNIYEWRKSLNSDGKKKKEERERKKKKGKNAILKKVN